MLFVRSTKTISRAQCSLEAHINAIFGATDWCGWVHIMWMYLCSMLLWYFDNISHAYGLQFVRHISNNNSNSIVCIISSKNSNSAIHCASSIYTFSLHLGFSSFTESSIRKNTRLKCIYRTVRMPFNLHNNMLTHSNVLVKRQIRPYTLRSSPALAPSLSSSLYYACLYMCATRYVHIFICVHATHTHTRYWTIYGPTKIGYAKQPEHSTQCCLNARGKIHVRQFIDVYT